MLTGMERNSSRTLRGIDVSDTAITSTGSATPSGERRQVTALFADMVGFTGISERLGEEGTFALIQPIYELMGAAVSEQGGSVKDFTGDEIMALFGVPDTLEDAPLRACRAGLLIHERLAAATPAIEAKHGVRPQMRIGINSGLAVVTQLRGISGPATALGDTVNFAARLQTLAEPGTVYLSEATQRLVEGLVETSFAGAHTIKGKTEPQNVYRLDGIRRWAARFDAALGRGLSAYVGRERELEILERAFVVAREDLRVVDIVAEPGMGKSRLLTNFAGGSVRSAPLSWSAIARPTVSKRRSCRSSKWCVARFRSKPAKPRARSRASSRAGWICWGCLRPKISACCSICSASNRRRARSPGWTAC